MGKRPFSIFNMAHRYDSWLVLVSASGTGLTHLPPADQSLTDTVSSDLGRKSFPGKKTCSPALHPWYQLTNCYQPFCNLSNLIKVVTWSVRDFPLW